MLPQSAYPFYHLLNDRYRLVADIQFVAMFEYTKLHAMAKILQPFAKISKEMTMKIDLNGENYKSPEVDIEKLVSRLLSGKALLFAGAGFSRGTLNVINEEPPLAKNLSKQICELGKFKLSDNLKFAADYFLANNGADKLISFLKEKYTIKQISDAQVAICRVPWRRIYTTNYDLSIEKGLESNSKCPESIDLNFDPSEYYSRSNLCIHINGSINILTSTTLNSQFKLSNSSYISADCFVESPWYYYFKKDLERCSALLFVGYSLYDIEIQKTLVQYDGLKEKTYFITGEDPDEELSFTLSKFGHIIPIGIKNLSKLISDLVIPKLSKKEDGYHLKSLQLVAPMNEKKEIRDSDIERMFMYGDIDDSFVESGVLGAQRAPYLILRAQLEKIKALIRDRSNVLICSELGNGKTMLLHELKFYLSATEMNIYEVCDSEGDYIDDIDFLSKQQNTNIIIIDGYDKYLDLLRHYCISKPKNIFIIASSRTSGHEKHMRYLFDIGFNYYEINVDMLDNKELEYFVRIADNLGAWGKNSGLRISRKTGILRDTCKSQLSLSLLHLFNAKQVRDKIWALMDSLCSEKLIKDTIFSISILSFLDIDATFSLVSEISGNNKIYTSELRRDDGFKQLFRLSTDKVDSKSSPFSHFLLTNYFSPSYSVEALQKIAERLDKYGRNRRDPKEDAVFKATLRFSFVERILEVNKKQNIFSYYENIKKVIPWLVEDPHFWMQYSMAHMLFKEYDKAQKLLDRAYALAKARTAGYHTKNLDAQQARLLLMLEETNGENAWDNFNKANRLLLSMENDVYKFRQVAEYAKFYSSCYAYLSATNKIKFKMACENMHRVVSAYVAVGGGAWRGHHVANEAVKKLEYIINHINGIIL